jgi:hypothetical protein
MPDYIDRIYRKPFFVCLLAIADPVLLTELSWQRFYKLQALVIGVKM